MMREGRALGPSVGFVPVVRRLEAKFRKPAKGAIVASASASSEKIGQLRAEPEKRGRTLIEVMAEIQDEAGAQTLSASVEWFIARAGS